MGSEVLLLRAVLCVFLLFIDAFLLLKKSRYLVTVKTTNMAVTQSIENEAWVMLQKSTNPVVLSYLNKLNEGERIAPIQSVNFDGNAPIFTANGKLWECSVCGEFNIDGKRRWSLLF